MLKVAGVHNMDSADRWYKQQCYEQDLLEIILPSYIPTWRCFFHQC